MMIAGDSSITKETERSKPPGPVMITLNPPRQWIGSDPSFVRCRKVPACCDDSGFNPLTLSSRDPLDVNDGDRH
jgi:hypothetical protein